MYNNTINQIKNLIKSITYRKTKGETIMLESVRIFKVGDEHGTKYNTCKEASDATGIPSNTIYHWMRNFPGKVYKAYDGTQYRIRPCRNRKEVAPCRTLYSRPLGIGVPVGVGLTIEQQPSAIIAHTRKKRVSKKLKVYNKTQNKYYTSMTEAGKDAHVSPWTLSVKTEKFGYFKADTGDIFVRLCPMKRRVSTPLINGGTEPARQAHRRKHSRRVPDIVNHNPPAEPSLFDVVKVPSVETTLTEHVKSEKSEDNDYTILKEMCGKYLAAEDMEMTYRLSGALLVLKKRMEDNKCTS